MHLEREGSSASCQFQGLPEASELYTSCLVSLSEGWTVSFPTLQLLSNSCLRLDCNPCVLYCKSVLCHCVQTADRNSIREEKFLVLTVWGSFSPLWWGRHWQQEQGLGVSHDNLTRKQRVKPETKLGAQPPQNLRPVTHLCHPGLNLPNIVEPLLNSVASWGSLLTELFVTSPLHCEISDILSPWYGM